MKTVFMGPPFIARVGQRRAPISIPMPVPGRRGRSTHEGAGRTRATRLVGSTDVSRDLRRPQGRDPLGGDARGVHAAHENGVTHRDLKPQNVFVIETGSGTRVRILDFGISTATTAAPLTRPGIVVGTWEYMSPEQARGEVADARSDQYSIGVMLYEAMVGRLPFESGITATLFSNIAEGRFAKPCAVDPAIGPEIEAIILRAMAKDASNRFPSVQALGAALLPHTSADDHAKWMKYFTVSDPNRIHSAPFRKESSGSVKGAPSPIKSDRPPRQKPVAAAKLSARDRKLIAGFVLTSLGALLAFVLAREWIGRSARVPNGGARRGESAKSLSREVDALS
jgi:serine/threonine protein kinase